MNAVPCDGPPELQALVQYLRWLKAEADATYRVMAQRTLAEGPVYCSPATLSSAASGTRLPSVATVTAFARAAVAERPLPASRRSRRPGRSGAGTTMVDTATAEDPRVVRAQYLHTSARRGQAVRSLPAPGRRPPRIRSQAGLGRYLVRLRAQAAHPTDRALEAATAQAGHRIPRTRLRRVFAGQTLPPREQLAALLTVLHADEKGGEAAQAARERLHEAAHPRRVIWNVCWSAEVVWLEKQARLERGREIRARVGALDPHEEEDWDWGGATDHGGRGKTPRTTEDGPAHPAEDHPQHDADGLARKETPESQAPDSPPAMVGTGPQCSPVIVRGPQVPFARPSLRATQHLVMHTAAATGCMVMVASD